MTYNRKKTLHRVYDSLKEQTYKNFEWIIIDDGSTDKTYELVEKWKAEKIIPIQYHYQENQGKHIGLNKCIDLANGEYFTVIDSDDEIKNNAFEILIYEWKNIPIEKRYKFVSVTVRCYDPTNGVKIGKNLPKMIIDCSSLDARYKYKMKYDRWGLSKTEIIKQFHYPNTKGKFYPEAIMQDECARKYLERYIDIPLKGYYQDTNNAITKKNELRKENIYLWIHNVNDNMDYFFYDIKDFLKSFVGISMYGFANDMKIRDIVKSGKGIYRKILILIFMPLGFILYKLYSKKYRKDKNEKN